MERDVVIIGAGPAGLFAANSLSNSGLDVLVIDQGKEPMKRLEENGLEGVGGAGAFSDGKLNLTYKIGGEPEDLKRTPFQIQRIIDSIDETLQKYGIPKEVSGVNTLELKQLKTRASKEGIHFIAGKQKHIGTDRIRNIMDDFYKDLKHKGINFLLEERVEEIEKHSDFVLKTKSREIRSKFLIAAPGREGSYWLRNQAEKTGVKTRYGPIDVGVRVEFPSEIYEKIKNIMYDAKFRFYTETYDDMVRTFCTNPGGFVSMENYGDFVLVNGHAKKDEKTENTNTAILTRVTLTDPVEDATRYGRSIAKLATTIGHGKPILQRFKDLKKGRRSTWERINKSSVSPTLTDVTPGDISMALPQRIVTNIVESLKKLDSIIPGIASDSILIYAPEIKFYDTEYQVDENLQTNVENFFVAGDASGHSRGIVYSAVTGKIAAEGILKKLNIN